MHHEAFEIQESLNNAFERIVENRSRKENVFAPLTNVAPLPILLSAEVLRASLRATVRSHSAVTDHVLSILYIFSITRNERRV